MALNETLPFQSGANAVAPIGAPTPDTTLVANQDQGNLPADQAKRQQEMEEHRKMLFEWTEARPRMEVLHGKWVGYIQKAIEMRLRRKIDLSPKRLRDEGKLKQDETIVPMRNIDTNIKREQPAYINFLVSPPRQYIFKCLDNPLTNTEKLESDVTTGVRYPGWAIPFFKTCDGAQLHGWDAMEVVFDASKPLHVAREHVGHDNLFFNTDSIDLQANEVIIRRYSVSTMQVMTYISEFGFDEIQANRVLEGYKGTGKKDYNVTLYKLYFKWKDVVYVAWYAMEYVQDWIKAPQKLRLGIDKEVPNPAFQQWQEQQQLAQQQLAPVINQIAPQAAPVVGQLMQQANPPPPQTVWEPQDIKDYPIFFLPYMENEEQALVTHIGRGFLDNPTQEAMTSIVSGFCNALNRSSNVYGSVAGDPSSTAAPKQLTTTLTNGSLYDREVKWFSTPPPEPQTLNALQFLDTRQSAEAGQISFAAQNREDSRKTAKEMTIATQQQQQISTVQVYLWATWLLQMANFEWLIIQSQALQDKITLLAEPQQELNTLNPQQDAPQQQVLVNNKDLIKLRYVLVPAGSVDVQERAEMLQQMKQDWPVFQQTPLATEFLKEYIRRAYPSQSNAWLAQLQMEANMKQLLAMTAQAAQMLADPAKVAALNPMEKQQLQQLMQQVQQAINPKTPVTVAGQQPAALDSNRLPEQVLTQADPSRSEQNR